MGALMTSTSITTLKVYIPQGLKTQFKALCVFEGKSMNAITLACIEKWVAEKMTSELDLDDNS